MLTGDGNEKCNKKSVGLKSEKKSLHVQHIFLYISLQLFCTTSTFLAANICHFLIATLNFFMFFSSAMNFASFLFFFGFVLSVSL